MFGLQSKKTSTEKNFEKVLYLCS